jgi:aminopeptidase-like protein
MISITELINELYAFNYSVTGSGSDLAAKRLCKELPFEIFEYESGQSLNGWKIPPACEVVKAELSKNGKLIYDGRSSALGVPAQSASFSGELSLEELEPHLFTAEHGDAIPYHWSNLYHTSDTLWGLCMPRRIKENLSEGLYSVELITRKIPATMKVLLYTLPGEHEDPILINAHNCHPYQANDDISGVATGIEIMRQLAKLPSRRYTYKLMIAPELFGPMFWLEEIGAEQSAKIRGVILLKSVGNRRNLRLQRSFAGNSLMDRAAEYVFGHRYGNFDSGDFRTIYGNDETVFEAPPYRIPSISLTRWPFDQYHTDLDTPEYLDEANLQDTVEATLEICDALEKNIVYEPNFSGLVCLSSYGLYKSVPSQKGNNGIDYYGSVQGRWNRLMNSLPSHLDDKDGLLTLAEYYRLPIGELDEYLREWHQKGLVKRMPWLAKD